MRVAGIVLYNPEIERLKENLLSISCQVDLVILIDNASDNIEDIRLLLTQFNNAELICNSENLGIAKALNQIGNLALDVGADWYLTLDQDSVCQPGLIREYEKVNKEDNVAIITCNIIDRNFKTSVKSDCLGRYVDFCITSGSYINTAIWEKLGKFDEVLFIDKVDTDFCFRATHSGYKIAKIDYFGLLHEVGYETTIKSFGGRKFAVFNHSAFRCYYIIRNQIYFARKHKEMLGKRGLLRYERTAWTRIFVYAIYEKDKYNKIKAWAKGLWDGYHTSIK